MIKKRLFCALFALLLLICAGCGGLSGSAGPSPTPEDFIRQSYDIEGLLVEDGEARVWGLVLNTGTLDIAYIGFTVELCDSRGVMLYEQRYETTLHEALVPGDCWPFNCVFQKIYDEDADSIAKVRIGTFTWVP